MSNQHINAAVNCYLFKGNTRLLLFVLANRASDGTSRNGKKNLPFGWTARSLEELMTESGMYRKPTIYACMTELIEMGAVKRKRRFKNSSLTFVDLDFLLDNAYTLERKPLPVQVTESVTCVSNAFRTDKRTKEEEPKKRTTALRLLNHRKAQRQRHTTGRPKNPQSSRYQSP